MDLSLAVAMGEKHLATPFGTVPGPKPSAEDRNLRSLA